MSRLTCMTRMTRGKVPFAVAGVATAWFATAACGAVQLADPVEPGPDLTAGVGPRVARPLWEIGLGVAGLRLPDYRGSDHNRTYVVPLPYLVYRGKWLKADRDGARAMLFDSDRFKVDVSVAASTPARSRDNDARAGMPDLSAIGEIGPDLNFTLLRSAERGGLRLDLRLPVRAAFTVQRSPRFIGTTFSPKLNLDVGKVAGGWNLGLQTGPLFADSKYHEHFYSVDAAYATADRPVYRARGGYAGWQALAATSRRIGDVWIGAFVRFDSLRGASFESSPLVRRDSALTFGLGASWILFTSSERVVSAD